MSGKFNFQDYEAVASARKYDRTSKKLEKPCDSPPNTKTNIHIHHSIFSSFYSTSLLLALTSYLPWIRRVGEARFHQFPLPGRSGILWIAICTRIVLLSRFFERRNPRNRGRIKYNLETGAPLSLFAVLESIAGGTGHIY